jgi:hypothetical protein
MSAPIPLRDWVRIMRPIGCDEAWIMTLTAYFDDSGTHPGSEVIVWAGFLGPEDRWLELDSEWRALLTKWGLSAFHMVYCVHGLKEYSGWSEPKRDNCIYEFREIILKQQLFGLGSAASAKDWDELVVGDHKKFLRTPDEFCLSCCIRDAVNFSREFSPHDKLSIVFDDRRRDDDIVNRMVEFYRARAGDDPELVSVTFQQMKSFSGLQAADMLAWETNRYAHEALTLASGEYPKARPHFQRFLDQGMLKGGIMRRHNIERLIASYKVRDDVPPELLKE